MTTTTRTSTRLSAAQVLFAIIASSIGFVIGFYAGAIGLLGTVGLAEFEGWQFPIATIPLGSLGAALGASLPLPHTGRAFKASAGAAAVAAAVSTIYVSVVNGDFGLAILLGGVLAVISSVVAGAVASSR